jgi:vitamin B12/bleomycin/antimicrobial peptide transport system ATP-binding/permease protein
MDAQSSAAALVQQANQTSLAALFWREAKGFWQGATRNTAWLLSLGMLAFVVIEVYFQYRLNVWNRSVFDGLEQRDGSAVLFQAMLFVPLALGSTASAVLIVYFRMKAQRRWRAWLTEHLLDRWLNRGRYYQLNFVPGAHENPEYRLAEDMRIATEAPLDFVSGLTTAVLTAVTFIGVLWAVGGSLAIPVGGADIVIPGYLVIAVVVYCGLISGGMVLIARRFVPIVEAKNQTEAEFRYALTRLRENGESIAILGGEREERAEISELLRKVVRNWSLMAHQYMRTTGVSHSNFILATAVPIILCAPKYIDGSMSLGQVTQSAAAFIQVQYAFNWLVNNYPRIAEWTASARRVSSLVIALDSLEKLEADGTIGSIVRTDNPSGAIRLNGLKVATSGGAVIVDEADVQVNPGDRVLLIGESGSGKSTLVRAIAGLWPWGAGEISVRPNARIFLNPQKPYIPLGTLRRAVTYPLSADAVDDEGVRRALEEVGLGHLVERLDSEVRWADVLSGGEQQRLSFARLLIHQPDIVVMDESTSALDTESQAQLLTRFRELLPNIALISVGHRSELETFHERKYNLVRGEGGAILIAADMEQAPTISLPSMMQRWPRYWRTRRAKVPTRASPLTKAE